MSKTDRFSGSVGLQSSPNRHRCDVRSDTATDRHWLAAGTLRQCCMPHQLGLGSPVSVKSN